MVTTHRLIGLLPWFAAQLSYFRKSTPCPAVRGERRQVLPHTCTHATSRPTCFTVVVFHGETLPRARGSRSILGKFQLGTRDVKQKNESITPHGGPPHMQSSPLSATGVSRGRMMEHKYEGAWAVCMSSFMETRKVVRWAALELFVYTFPEQKGRIESQLLQSFCLIASKLFRSWLVVLQCCLRFCAIQNTQLQTLLSKL